MKKQLQGRQSLSSHNQREDFDMADETRRDETGMLGIRRRLNRVLLSVELLMATATAEEWSLLDRSISLASLFRFSGPLGSTSRGPDETTSLTSGSTSESSGAKSLDSGVTNGRDLTPPPRPSLTNKGRKSGGGLAGAS